MKSVVFLFVLLCALMIGVGSSGSQASSKFRTQRAVTTFERPVNVRGVTLQGQYLFVHDDAAMARGEACTRIYKGDAPVAGKLVVSFHCVPVERAKSDHFVIRSIETSPGLVELQEFQFKGDTEAHAVPTSIDAHVNHVNP
jgi:hypothetical protein